jgi:hypothetical protein
VKDTVNSCCTSAPDFGVGICMQTFRGFIECSFNCHIRDLVDLDSVCVRCIWAFQKGFRGGYSSRSAAECVPFLEQRQSQDAGNVTIDTSDEHRLAIAWRNCHIEESFFIYLTKSCLGRSKRSRAKYNH